MNGSKSGSRPKIAIFSLTSCEGCQLQILNLEREFVELLSQVEIVNFREAIDDRRDDYEIAFIEGSVTTPGEAEEAREIRERARVVVAIGACAHLGGVNNLKNLHPRAQWLATVYGDAKIVTESHETKKVSEVVPVDFVLPGCPIDKGEFLSLVTSLLLGASHAPPDRPVCVECRSKDNVCLIEEGRWCLGSVTRAGCDAICPTYGDPCAGCRGILEEANTVSLAEILAEKGYTTEEVRAKFELFNQKENVKLGAKP
jgi:coenzyme F420-reducing hydrogenase gamma subunit